MAGDQPIGGTSTTARSTMPTRASVAIAFFRDHEHLLAFQTGVVATLPGVTAVETAIVVRVAKFSYEWEI
jgi:hypothetical protein